MSSVKETIIKGVVFDLDNTLLDFMKMKQVAVRSAIRGMIEAGLEIDENNISEDRKSLEKGNISISALTPILYSLDNNDIARSWTKKLNN